MTFLEARRIVARFGGGPNLPFRLGASGTVDSMLLYIQATAAQQGMQADIRTLPFATLEQHLRSPADDMREVFLLFPWDLCPAADWRSGTPAQGEDAGELRARAENFMRLVSRRNNAAVLYVSAPLPPIMANARNADALSHWLTGEAVAGGATVVPGDVFSMETYCRSGTPLGTEHLGAVARQIVTAATRAAASEAKVLVTDFDNVLWRGVVGEDGPNGVHQRPDALGYPHFIYQTYLKLLENAGVVIAGVTRNDYELALAPLRTGSSIITENDLVAIVASYNAKSAQIAELAAMLNLGLDSFVFVDDNPLEIAEVAAALPQVRTFQFPARASGLPALLDQLSHVFHRESTTAEDALRTELYRSRATGIVPSSAQGADLTAFLVDLQMRLTIHDRSGGDRARAVQLINKTNQFNLNGVRRTDEEVDAILAGGGRLLTASLDDRNGSHGEILAFLSDQQQVVHSFVLSCRVFQRRVEHAFLGWMASRQNWPGAFEFRPTERNEPFRKFLAEANATIDEGTGRVRMDADEFMRLHAHAIQLFDVTEQSLGVDVS